MELLEGLDLETLVRRHGPMPAERVSFLLLQVCHSLSDAHSRGLIHRDVKPANIYVCNKGLDFDFVKVLDFGLVALQSELAGDDARITAEGAVAGTPAYMAPELAAEGADVDARADVYALGCVAYWMLAGRLVFEGESAVGVIVAHASKAPSPPSEVSEVEIPPALEALVLACLEKSPGDRPASAAALALALERTGLPQRWNEERARAWWTVNSPRAVPGPVSGASLAGAT
jgi:serine/threonine-protein kinase